MEKRMSVSSKDYKAAQMAKNHEMTEMVEHMTEKHTEGPWTCDERGLVSGLDRDRPESPSFDIFDAEEWPGSEQEALANAKLIAAAPEMLEALEKAEEWLKGWASAKHGLEIIQAVIAKAKGLDG